MIELTGLRVSSSASKGQTTGKAWEEIPLSQSSNNNEASKKRLHRLGPVDSLRS